MSSLHALCDFEGCGRNRWRSSWCYGHFQQARRGEPLAPVVRLSSVSRVRALFEAHAGRIVTAAQVLAELGYPFNGSRSDLALVRRYVYLERHREGMVIDRVRGRGWRLRGFAL